MTNWLVGAHLPRACCGHEPRRAVQARQHGQAARGCSCHGARRRNEKVSPGCGQHAQRTRTAAPDHIPFILATDQQAGNVRAAPTAARGHVPTCARWMSSRKGSSLRAVSLHSSALAPTRGAEAAPPTAAACRLATDREAPPRGSSPHSQHTRAAPPDTRPEASRHSASFCSAGCSSSMELSISSCTMEAGTPGGSLEDVPGGCWPGAGVPGGSGWAATNTWATCVPAPLKSLLACQRQQGGRKWPQMATPSGKLKHGSRQKSGPWWPTLTSPSPTPFSKLRSLCPASWYGSGAGRRGCCCSPSGCTEAATAAGGGGPAVVLGSPAGCCSARTAMARGALLSLRATSLAGRKVAAKGLAATFIALHTVNRDPGRREDAIAAAKGRDSSEVVRGARRGGQAYPGLLRPLLSSVLSTVEVTKG